MPATPASTVIFVTGTDTEVGKTLIAGAIARRLRSSGRRVEVFKPAATGCRRAGGQYISADAEFLAACADSRRRSSSAASATKPATGVGMQTPVRRCRSLARRESASSGSAADRRRFSRNRLYCCSFSRASSRGWAAA